MHCMDHLLLTSLTDQIIARVERGRYDLANLFEECRINSKHGPTFRVLVDFEFDCSASIGVRDFDKLHVLCLERVHCRFPSRLHQLLVFSCSFHPSPTGLSHLVCSYCSSPWTSTKASMTSSAKSASCS